MIIEGEDFSTPHYFGITGNDLAKRLKSHVYMSTRPAYKKKFNYIHAEVVKKSF
jgi:hypothetical protein